MKRLIPSLLILFMATTIFSQTLYFPPLFGSDWENTTPEELGWCTENIEPLYDYLEENETKAFIVLKDGKIVLEKYFGTFTQDSAWYWASAGKSLTAFMVGLAQEDGYLSIHHKTSSYLGTGWTSGSAEQEEKITIRHQLTMTTGLDDRVDDANCTLPECLEYVADPGTRWAYHNAPYTLLDQVIEGASGKNLNGYINEKLTFTTGMTGTYFKLGYNNVFISKPRSMARFGLLMLNQGNWNGTQIMQDTAYLHDMINSSQDLNQSYGYLWWLNGKESFMMPGSQFVFDGSAVPNAPADMVCALGKNGQILNVVPSENLIMVRMGNAPADFGGAISVELNRGIWEYFTDIYCTTASSQKMMEKEIQIFPNPVKNQLNLKIVGPNYTHIDLFNSRGNLKESFQNKKSYYEIPVQTWKPGVYYLRLRDSQGNSLVKSFLKL